MDFTTVTRSSTLLDAVWCCNDWIGLKKKTHMSKTLKFRLLDGWYIREVSQPSMLLFSWRASAAAIPCGRVSSCWTLICMALLPLGLLSHRCLKAVSPLWTLAKSCHSHSLVWSPVLLRVNFAVLVAPKARCQASYKNKHCVEGPVVDEQKHLKAWPRWFLYWSGPSFQVAPRLLGGRNVMVEDVERKN